MLYVFASNGYLALLLAPLPWLLVVGPITVTSMLSRGVGWGWGGWDKGSTIRKKNNFAGSLRHGLGRSTDAQGTPHSFYRRLKQKSQKIETFWEGSGGTGGGRGDLCGALAPHTDASNPLETVFRFKLRVQAVQNDGTWFIRKPLKMCMFLVKITF